jgi:hypothetical protein
LLETLPTEIPVSRAPALPVKYGNRDVDRKSLTGGAVAPLWFTVRAPKNAKAGMYQGQITISAAGLAVRGEASKAIALVGVDLDRYDRIVSLRSKVVAGVARRRR